MARIGNYVVSTWNVSIPSPYHFHPHILDKQHRVAFVSSRTNSITWTYPMRRLRSWGLPRIRGRRAHSICRCTACVRASATGQTVFRDDGSSLRLARTQSADLVGRDTEGEPLSFRSDRMSMVDGRRSRSAGVPSTVLSRTLPRDKIRTWCLPPATRPTWAGRWGWGMGMGELRGTFLPTGYSPDFTQAKRWGEDPPRPAYKRATVLDYPPRKPARKGGKRGAPTDRSQPSVGRACRLRSSHLALAALARVNWNPRG